MFFFVNLILFEIFESFGHFFSSLLLRFLFHFYNFVEIFNDMRGKDISKSIFSRERGEFLKNLEYRREL